MARSRLYHCVGIRHLTGVVHGEDDGRVVGMEVEGSGLRREVRVRSCSIQGSRQTQDCWYWDDRGACDDGY